jgi:hypothetical protein
MQAIQTSVWTFYCNKNKKSNLEDYRVGLCELSFIGEAYGEAAALFSLRTSGLRARPATLPV